MADIEYVYRKEDEGTAKDLYDGCNSGKYSLPMLVVVNNGFYSNREETTFSTGQVLMIHEIRTQDRVLVHDCNKKTLTVPLDYTHRFTVGHSNVRLLLDRLSLCVARDAYHSTLKEPILCEDLYTFA
ncbi:hypothetical protein BaRGS_00005907 [Batillaria attramentaria]|uniref:Uncharacterized protein n=1 Tax=Batillaria attramentaria TaxID=370345 RepID=A0ABD0LU85_9CAEN